MIIEEENSVLHIHTRQAQFGRSNNISRSSTIAGAGAKNYSKNGGTKRNATGISDEREKNQ